MWLKDIIVGVTKFDLSLDQDEMILNRYGKLMSLAHLRQSTAEAGLVATLIIRAELVKLI